MTAPKFTPGPWEAACDSARNPRRMALVRAGGNRCADFTGSGDSYAEDCANARLAASAPELYEALAQCENELALIVKDATVDLGYRDGARHLLKVARSALGKAVDRP